jgi:hypothetical protein
MHNHPRPALQVYINVVKKETNLNIWAMMYYNNVTTMPFLFLLAWYTGDLKRACECVRLARRWRCGGRRVGCWRRRWLSFGPASVASPRLLPPPLPPLPCSRYYACVPLTVCACRALPVHARPVLPGQLPGVRLPRVCAVRARGAEGTRRQRGRTVGLNGALYEERLRAHAHMTAAPPLPLPCPPPRPRSNVCTFFCTTLNTARTQTVVGQLKNFVAFLLGLGAWLTAAQCVEGGALAAGGRAAHPPRAPGVALLSHPPPSPRPSPPLNLPQPARPPARSAL